MYRYTRINPKTANERWSQVLMESTGIKDPAKLDWMSRLAEIKYDLDGPSNASERKLYESIGFTEHDIQKMNESAYGLSSPSAMQSMGPATWPSDPGTGVGANRNAWYNSSYSNGSGDVPTQIMGMAMNVAAYCVGFDLVNTIPVDMPTAFYSFLDAVYGGGKTGSKTPPQYLQLRDANINPTFMTNLNMSYGGYMFISAAAGGGWSSTPAIRAKFIGTSFASGNILFKVEGCGTISTTTFTPDTAGSEQLISTIMSGIASGGVITPGSTATAVDGTSRAVAAPTVDVVSSIYEHIQGASNNDGITKYGMTRDELEAGTDRKINLRLWSKTSEMRGLDITADITKVQLRDLKAYGVDGVADLYKASQNQIIQSLNEMIIDQMARLGVQNHVQLLTSQNVNLNLYVGPGGTASKAFTSFTGVSEFVDATGTSQKSAFGSIVNSETNSSAENQYTRARKIYSRIMAASALIGNVGRHGEGDVCVLGGQLATALKDVKGFTAAPVDNTIGGTNDLHFIGTIGNIKCYKNPKWSWNDWRVIVGLKGDESTPGLKFLAYDLAASVEIINPGTYAPSINVWSRFDLVPAGFYPELQYLTFGVHTDFGNWV